MQTITIAICDSDPKELAIISGAVRAAFESNSLEPRIETFSSAVKMQEELTKKPVHLILTCIEMPQFDGIQFGRQLRAQGSWTEIIYVTGAEGRVFEAFDAQPFGFVRKANFLKDMADTMDRYIRSRQAQAPSGEMDLPTRSSGRLHVSLDDILYFEGEGMYQRLFLRDGRQEQLSSRMDHLEAALRDQGFLRLHKGFLVNCRYITKLSREEATLADGRALPISRRRSGQVRQAYLQFGKDHGVFLF